MLLFQDPRREGGLVVAWNNWNTRLDKDRSSVELGRNEVNRAAVFSQALGERSLVSVEAA